MRIGIAYLIFETEHKKITCVRGHPSDAFGVSSPNKVRGAYLNELSN